MKIARIRFAKTVHQSKGVDGARKVSFSAPIVLQSTISVNRMNAIESTADTVT